MRFALKRINFTLQRSIRYPHTVNIQIRSFLIKEDEDHQKSFIPRATGGNKVSYSDMYINKKRKKASKSFWGSYRKALSAIILATAGTCALLFCGHRLYENYQKKSGKQITEKLAENQSDQQTLNRIASDIATNFILPQFNKPIANTIDSETHFKHIPRPFSSIQPAISDAIYAPHRTAWNICCGFGGAGISSNFKDAYNHTIAHKIKADEKPRFLYLNFQEIDASNNCLESLIKYHWNNQTFNITDYGLDRLPATINEYDILRKALLMAIKTQYVANKKQEAIILVIDGLEELIFKDPDFKFWIMFLGAAVQQRMVSILSVLPNECATKFIGETLATTYGTIANMLMKDDKTPFHVIEFFSEEEVLEIVELNMAQDIDCKLLASKLYEITKGYPVLLSDIIMAMNEDKLAMTDVLEQDNVFDDWFDDWYGDKYVARYIVPSLKFFIATSMAKSDKALDAEIRKLMKQIRGIIIHDTLQLDEDIVGDVDGMDVGKNENENEINTELIDLIAGYVERMDVGKAFEIGILFHDYVCQQNDISVTLPIIKAYWKRHSLDEISEKILTALTESVDSDVSSAHELLLRMSN